MFALITTKQMPTLIYTIMVIMHVRMQDGNALRVFSALAYIISVTNQFE